MSYKSHGHRNENESPRSPSRAASLYPNEAGPLPIADETLDALSGKVSSIKNQVLQIWDDLRKRWRAGDQCDVRNTWPQSDLAASEAAAVDLIYAEYLLWEEAGKSPQAEDFLRLFPQYADSLRRNSTFTRS